MADRTDFCGKVGFLAHEIKNRMDGKTYAAGLLPE